MPDVDSGKTWYGFTECGCPAAWSLSHPSELPVRPDPPVVVWRLLDTMATVPLRHPIIESARVPLDPTVPIELAWSQEGNRVDWTPGVCERTGPQQFPPHETWVPA